MLLAPQERLPSQMGHVSAIIILENVLHIQGALLHRASCKIRVIDELSGASARAIWQLHMCAKAHHG